MIKTKKQMYVVIGAFLLVLGLFTTTYAFFNYTRTGSSNVIKTGRISFNTTQDGTLNLTNVFPVESSSVGNDYTQDTVKINVIGDTTYSEGIEYLVTAEEVNVETSTGKKVPLTLKVDVTNNLGTEDTDIDQIEYFTDRGGNTSYYKNLSESILYDGQYLLVGYIAPGATGINGTINIKAYLDSSKVAISDTYPEENEDTNSDGYIDGTPNSFGTGRVVLTTNEWNSLQQQGNELSFKIRVEANEGTWVDPATNPNATDRIPSSLTNGVTEIYFIKETPIRMQRRYEAATVKADMTDTTLNEGKVLAWQEGNKLYIASSGETYLPAYCPGFFAGLSNVTKIELNNVNTSRVTHMGGMFSGCTSLVSLNLNGLGSNILSNVGGMFNGCTSLKTVNMDNYNFGLNMDGLFYEAPNVEEISLKNADTSKVTSMRDAFTGTSIKKIDLSGFGNNNLTNIQDMLKDCQSLEEVNMSGFNFGTASMGSLFENDINLKTIDLSNANTSNVTNMAGLFVNCTSLLEIDLSNLGGNNLSGVSGMFYGCTNLKEINMSGFNFGTATTGGLFGNLSNLEVINLSHANFSNVSDVWGMFASSTKLKTIKVSADIDFTNYSPSDSSYMFAECTSLVGGQGTTYDPDHTGPDYAKVDGGPNNKGYFTLAN